MSTPARSSPNARESRLPPALGVLSVLFLLFHGSAPAASLHLGPPDYTVDVSAAFQVAILLDMDETTPGDQVPASGLFSAGSQIAFRADAFSVGGPDDVVLPAELDGNGLGGPPTKVVEPGRAGAAGVIGFFAEAGYDQPTVLTVTLTATAPGTFTLTPGLLNKAPLANFLDFNGVLLDPEITTFVPSIVHVACEPRLVGIERNGAGGLRLLFQHGKGEDSLYLERWSALAVGGAWVVDAPAVIREADAGLWEALTTARSDRGAHFRIRAGETPAQPRWVGIERGSEQEISLTFEYVGLPADFALERQQTAGAWEAVAGAVFEPLLAHCYRVTTDTGSAPTLRYRIGAQPR